MTKDVVLKDKNAARFFGCSHADAVALNDGLPLRQPFSKAACYQAQRGKAKRRGIAWEISFADWLDVWNESGRWSERGIGASRYCMARHGDTGPYKVGNVSIQTNSANSRDGVKKSHVAMAARGTRYTPLGTGRGWTYRAGAASPYQVFVGRKYIGVFKTQGDAEIARATAVCQVSTFHSETESPFFNPA
jgi:hypothetical protein